MFKLNTVGRKSQPKRTRKEWRGAIIGMVLGDSSLIQPKHRDGIRRGNYLLDMSHSRRQKEYLEFKRDILNEIFEYHIPVRDITVTIKKIGKSYPASRVFTRVHSRFKMIAKNIYINGKKRITPWALDNITDEGLAIWWMDDGCMHYDPRPDHGGGFCVWGTYGFQKEEVQLFQDWLKNTYGISLRLSLNKKSGGWYLRRGMSEAVKLNDICRQYAHPSMLYKFSDTSKAFKRGPYNLSNSVRPLSNPKGDEIVQSV